MRKASEIIKWIEDNPVTPVPHGPKNKSKKNSTNKNRPLQNEVTNVEEASNDDGQRND